MKYCLILLFPSVALAGYNFITPSGSYLPGSDYSESGSSVGGINFVSDVNVQPSGSYLPSLDGGVQFGSGSGQFNVGIQGGAGGLGGFSHGFGGAGEETEVHYYGGDDHHQQSRLRIHLAPAPSRSRVLFVKSPDVGTIVPEIVAPSTPSHERTVVYLLSKKQEGVGSINIPAGVANNVVRTKPEVYYLRYKDAHDAERAVADSLSGKSAGAGVRYLNNKESFVKSLSSGIPEGAISGTLGSYGSGSGGVVFGGGVGDHGVGVGGVNLGGIGGSGGIQVVGSGSSGSNYGVPGASGPY